MRRQKPRGPSPQEIVDAWNYRCPVGSAVIVTNDSGAQIPSIVLAPAEVLGGHTPVGWFRGIRGCYALVRAVPENGLAAESLSDTKRGETPNV